MIGRASIVREGDTVIIRMPIEDVVGLRVALRPCPCKGAKSTTTAAIRDRLALGLAAALFPRKQKPEDQ